MYPEPNEDHLVSGCVKPESHPSTDVFAKNLALMVCYAPFGSQSYWGTKSSGAQISEPTFGKSPNYSAALCQQSRAPLGRGQPLSYVQPLGSQSKQLKLVVINHLGDDHG